METGALSGCNLVHTCEIHNQAQRNALGRKLELAWLMFLTVANTHGLDAMLVPRKLARRLWRLPDRVARSPQRQAHQPQHISSIM
ncbi:hypothetical protein VTN96DRAFT_8852 [Rasamsonia emersonii]